ncbi:hypothetical protein ML462_14135 [Gramella lutea]|uniref:Baseplate structural protein Gp10 C-terminal domain-containing protein n=1 Tax=Christiangramia lutea TaxID=1607951 RepID=A0A9X1V586_9FLAO|nr:hypothetical protein [Christiangramia lutea]MCH4824311.1 hypothetical protein [Christiangramia lutea]
MNKIQVLGGGFPGTSKTWRFVRDMINEVHDLATALGGENCIVKGCEVSNNVAQDGIIIIAGEALLLQGGAVKAYVEIVENVEQVEYFIDSEGDGQADINDAYFDRYARFADAGEVQWSDLKRISSLSEIAKRMPPKRCAFPYWGPEDEIPEDYQLCDGTNGLPDMRGMFVVGLDPDDPDHDEIGKTGGESKHTLTEAEMPAHNHSGNTGYGGYHTHNYSKSVPGRGYETRSDDNPHGSYETAQTSGSGGHTHSLTTNNKGGGQPHENRPKFYTMAWIAYVG